jgi:hypothetical protein
MAALGHLRPSVSSFLSFHGFCGLLEMLSCALLKEDQNSNPSPVQLSPDLGETLVTVVNGLARFPPERSRSDESACGLTCHFHVHIIKRYSSI